MEIRTRPQSINRKIGLFYTPASTPMMSPTFVISIFFFQICMYTFWNHVRFAIDRPAVFRLTPISPPKSQPCETIQKRRHHRVAFPVRWREYFDDFRIKSERPLIESDILWRFWCAVGGKRAPVNYTGFLFVEKRTFAGSVFIYVLYV